MTSPSLIAEIPVFLQLKIWLVAVAGVTADAMHIYMGTLCFLITVAVVKNPLRFTTLVPVISLAFTVEIFDLYYDAIGSGQLRIAESAHDFVNTCLVPVLMLSLLRIFSSAPAEKPEIGQSFK